MIITACPIHVTMVEWRVHFGKRELVCWFSAGKSGIEINNATDKEDKKLK